MSVLLFMISSQCPVQNGACPTEWGFNWHSGGTLPDLSEGGMDEVSSYISFSLSL